MDANKTEEFFDRVGSSNPNRTNGLPQEATASVPLPGNIFATEGDTRGWAQRGEIYWGVSLTRKILPKGFYRCGYDPSVGFFLSQYKLDTDTIVRITDTSVEQIVLEIEEFNRVRGRFCERGLLHKRGILLWGPPGSGKTCAIRLLIDLLVGQRGGIAIQIDQPNTASACLQMVRRAEPERQIVAILEDLDSLIDRYSESEYLAMLDGESQVDNIVFVATTNYPERLDRRFVDRPSRFDTIMHVGMPGAVARRMYLASKEPGLSEIDLSEMVNSTEDFSIAHLRELIVLTQCFGRPIKDSVKRLRTSLGKKYSSADAPGKKAFGFISVNP